MGEIRDSSRPTVETAGPHSVCVSRREPRFSHWNRASDSTGPVDVLVTECAQRVGHTVSSKAR